MSLKPTHCSGVKEQQGNIYSGANTGGASGSAEGVCQDEVEDKGLDLTSEVSQQFGDASTDGSDSLFLPHQEEAVGDETVGANLHPDSKSISAMGLQQQLVVIGSQDLSVLLPEEVVLNLFKFYLKPGDVRSASQTCRLWRILGENDKLWQKKCQEAGLTYSLNSADLKIVECRTKETTFAYSPWKINFLKPFKIERKFRQEVPQVLTIERSHNVYRRKVFNDKIVCSNAKTLYVFSALSGDLLHELVGHTRGVSSVQMDEKFIISGSNDESVKVWDVATGSCLHTMRGHTDGVICLKMHGNIAVSGSHDGTLRVWDVREGSCLRILSGHNGTVYHVQFDGRLVVSGSGDRTIKIWDPETGECRRTMNHDSQIHSLKFNGTDVVASYEDGSIKVWDVDTGVCRHTLVGNNSFWVMELQGNILVCRGADRTTAKIWSNSTGACLHTLAGQKKHSGIITGIQFNRKFVVTSSGDGTVKLWDIKTGEFIRDLLVLESGEKMMSMRMKYPKIVCTVSLNEGIKLIVLNFDTNNEDYKVNQG